MKSRLTPDPVQSNAQNTQWYLESRVDQPHIELHIASRSSFEVKPCRVPRSCQGTRKDRILMRITGPEFYAGPRCSGDCDSGMVTSSSRKLWNLDVPLRFLICNLDLLLLLNVCLITFDTVALHVSINPPPKTPLQPKYKIKLPSHSHNLSLDKVGRHLRGSVPR